MKQVLFVIVISFSTMLSIAQTLSEKDKSAIHNVMAHQEKCWNAGDIDCFMNGYWRSDSLKFIGRKGLIYGWQQTLDNYKESYPNKLEMGQLTFNILSTELLSEGAVLLIGKWHLKREENEDLGGHFSLNWKKVGGKWLIIADHSS